MNFKRNVFLILTSLLLTKMEFVRAAAPCCPSDSREMAETETDHFRQTVNQHRRKTALKKTIFPAAMFAGYIFRENIGKHGATLWTKFSEIGFVQSAISSAGSKCTSFKEWVNTKIDPTPAIDFAKNHKKTLLALSGVALVFAYNNWYILKGFGKKTVKSFKEQVEPLCDQLDNPKDDYCLTDYKWKDTP